MEKRARDRRESNKYLERARIGTETERSTEREIDSKTERARDR